MGRKSLRSVRQAEIIKAFYKVAKKEGLEHASIAKVADVLDVNPSLVIHYFSTKQALIHGLIEYILERYQRIYNPENGATDPKSHLKKIILNLFSRKWDKLFDDGVFYSSFSLIFRERALKRHYKKMHDKLRDMLAQTLRDAQAQRVISIADVDKTADLIFITLEGAYYYLSMVWDKKEYDLRLRYYQQTVLTMLGLE